MRVNCENCNTNFNLDEGLVKSTGSKVRCSKCRHIFVVYPPMPEADEPSAEAPEMDVAQDTGEAFQAPADEFETADPEDRDADDLEDVNASDASLLDEAPAEEAEVEDMDLSDIEKMLEIEEKADVPKEASEESLSPEDTDNGEEDTALDLSDIEKILDEEGDSDELVEEKSDENEDLVFDLDEELEMEFGGEQISPTTELDLGDLEKMFESDESPDVSLEETLETEADEASSMSFGLEVEEEDLSLMPEPEESEAGEEMSLEMEDAAFKLDVETEDVSLEEEAETEEAEAESLDLEIGIEVEPSEAEAEEIDLEGEIEPEPSALEMEAEDSAETEALLDGELELTLESQDEELALEDVGEISSEASEGEAEEEDLADFGEEADMEYPDDAVPDIPDEEELFDEEAALDEELPDLEEDLESEDDFEEVPVAATSGSWFKKLLGLLAVVLVILLLLAAFLFLNSRGILHVPYLDQVRIPFLSSQKVSPVADVGNLSITYNVDTYRFLETERAGKLFLITGKVKNDYSMSRSFIQMSGNLYTKGKILAGSATAYCGNVIADLELSQMTPAAIRTRMGNRSGENNSNVNIKPGEERPFMIVFFDLPESLDEFTVAVVGSSAGDR